MENAEVRISLVIIISFFIHAVFFTSVIMPSYDNPYSFLFNKKISGEDSIQRDIIVNINQDNLKQFNEKTLLSDKDSSAKGYITKQPGDQWLNNSRDFALRRGSRNKSRNSEKHRNANMTGNAVSDNTQIILNILKEDVDSLIGEEGNADYTTIPDKYSFTKDNAIFYSNDGMFSFNTKAFKPFKFFKEMKDKIASNWYPPLLANSVIYGVNPMTGSYTPGRVRIMAIPNQMVKLYFIMNRKGDVTDVEIVDSFGNKTLDASCVDAVKNSKSFGIVPPEIEGDEIVIKFVFIYIVN